MVTIRPVHLSHDLTAIMQLEQATFGRNAFPLSEFLYLYRLGEDYFLVANDRETLIGYISAYHDGTTGYIASLAVSTTHRKRGIGRRLLNEVITRFQAITTLQTIQLHVRQSNTAAIALYQALAFSTTSTVPQYYGDEDAYLMTHTLSR